MAKRGGFGGGMVPGNINQLMKQAQKMQKQMEEQSAVFEGMEFSSSFGGGAVSITVSGRKEVTKVSINKEVVDPEDVEMLEDLIMVATNEALRKMEEEHSALMGGIAGGAGKLPF